MHFTNSTPYPATLFRAGLFYKDLIMTTVVAKCTFEVSGGSARRSENPLPLVEADLETEYGVIDGDLVPVKEGCDFAVMGHAVAGPKGVETSEMLVSIRVGPMVRALKVFGDRYWQKGFGAFYPSVPRPFHRMPLDYRHAYGGTAMLYDSELDIELEMMSPLNMNGKGYVEMEEHVKGTALPNIEEVDNLIEKWTDRPDPAGCAPVPRQLPLRGLRGIDVNLKEEKTRLDGNAFLFCHPLMHLSRYPAEERVVVSGMTEDGTWSTLLPAIDLSLLIELGEQKHTLPLIPDTLVMLPGENRFFVLARQAFVYQFIPERERRVCLACGVGGASQNMSTIVKEREGTGVGIPIGPENPEMMPFPFDEFLSYYPLTETIEKLPLLPSG